MPKDTNTPIEPKFYRISDVERRLTLCRASIYNRMRRDPTFPRSVKLTSRTVAWIREEIEAWADNRPRNEGHHGR